MFHERWFLIFAVLCALGFVASSLFWAFIHLYRQIQIKKNFSGPIVFPHARSLYKVIQGCKLHYLVEGSGPDVLLIHGLGANIYCWRKLIPILAKNHRVWAIDLKGFGLSDKPRDSSYSLEAQSGLLSKFMDQEKVKELAVVGNSMGGAIAIQLGLDRPDIVKHLILISSAHDTRMFGKPLKTFAKLMKVATPAAVFFAPLVNEQSIGLLIQNIYGDEKYEVTPLDVRAYVAPYMDGTDSHRAFAAAFDGLASHNLTAHLKRIQSRTLILWGANDKVVPIKFGEMLHNDLPRSTYRSHPTGGHHLQEEEPQWVSSEINAFLKN